MKRRDEGRDDQTRATEGEFLPDGPVSGFFLPDDDLSIEGAGAENAPKVWVSPRHLPHRSLVSALFVASIPSVFRKASSRRKRGRERKRGQERGREEERRREPFEFGGETHRVFGDVEDLDGAVRGACCHPLSKVVHLCIVL